MVEIACLIPVRNASRDLKLCLDSLQPLNPAVLALDDGSTDDTADILRAHSLVQRVLKHPKRETYEGWDDSLNRTVLLKAAEDFKPRWIFWIDADEVLPAEDAEHLRRFLRSDAVPEAAYGLRRYRMIGDMTRFDKSLMWVYRIFGYRPGQTLPTERLHFEPVPLSIDKARWIRTRFRLMHRAGLTVEDRLARYQKYEAADPDRQWQDSYENLLEPPGMLHAFEPFDPARDVIIDRTRFQKLRATP